MLKETIIANIRIYRIAVSSIFFLAGLCFSSWASRIPDIQQKLHLNNAALGGVLLALPSGLLTSLPIAGWLVAKFGSRIVVICAALLYACTLPMLGIVPQTWQLVACLFVFGMASNMLNISMNTQAVSTEALYERTIMASYHGLWSLAGFSGAAIGTLIVGLGIAPYQHFLIITSALLLILSIASRFLLKEDSNRNEHQPIFAKPDKSLINLGIIAFCSMICEGAMFDWSGVYFQKVIHPDKTLVAAGYTAFMSTMATGRFIGDWFTTKIGIKKILQVSGALTATGLLIAILFPYFITAIIGFLFVGAGVSSVVPLVYSAAGRSKVLSPGVAIAAVSTIGYLGFLFGPPCIGFIAQASSLRISFALIAVLGSAITVMATRTKFD
ncbi:MAG: MFS transporter [Bacteroidetes bacterium]|nr:MFS transporter [Bacteroidota bacterium]